MNTIDNLTNARIEALRNEAAAAGDTATVRDCERALSTSSAVAARKRLVDVIRNAEAQQ